MNAEINFLINEMTFLRLFLPLVVEGNKRGIKSNFFYFGASGKYSCVNTSKNKPVLLKILKEHGANAFPADILPALEKASAQTVKAPFFCVCGVGSNFAPEAATIFSMTYGSDFINMYDRYIDKVDHVIFPGKDFAVSTNKMSEKNLYLGSPKFGVSYDKEEVCEKYGLSKERKKALIIFPDYNKYPPKVELKEVYQALEKSDYDIIVKSRGKNPVHPAARGHYYFEDSSWYPHTTLELIEASDLVVTHAASATIKEIINFKKPFLDLDVQFKKQGGKNPRPTIRDNFHFLYDYNFYRVISGTMLFPTIREQIRILEENDYTEQFDLAIERHFCAKNTICANILDKAFELTK